MKKHSKQLTLIVVKILAVILLHEILIYWLAEKQIVSTLLAAGQHLPLTTALLAVTFLMLRLILFVYVPGRFLAQIGILLWTAFVESRS
jgi:hypothetical protein